MRNRGTIGWSRSGFFTVIRRSEEPKRVLLSAATAMSRNAVRLSGSEKSNFASPFVSVRSAGAQKADDRNFERMRPDDAGAASPPSSGSPASGSARREMRLSVVAVSTPRPHGA